MAEQKFTTEQLRQWLEAGKTAVSFAKEYNVSERNVRRRVKKLKESGFDPENYRAHRNPENQVVGGYSTLVRFPDDDPLGRVLEWVKTRRSVSEQLEAIGRICKSMAEDVPPVSAVKYLGDKRPSKSHTTVIPIGDPHVGLMTWSKEVGEDWDVNISMRVFKNVFTRLLEQCPNTEECILVNTGDFFHADNIEGQTSRSRHKLDLDGRHGKWLDAGGALLLMFVDMCLKKYKKVTFVNVPGNHDDILGRFLGTLVPLVYRNEKRLTVLKGDSPRQYLQRGLVGIGFAHSHLCKMKQLPQAFAMDAPKIWGETRMRIFVTGHVHHDQELLYKDNNGCIVTSAGIIPPADAYAHGAGYSAQRTIQAIIIDAENGEIINRPCATVRSKD